MKREIEKKYDNLQKYDNLLGDLYKLEKGEQIPKDLEFDHLRKKISSYGQKEENEPKGKNKQKGEKIETSPSLAKCYIRSGEGILSKHMDFGLTTYEMAFKDIKETGENIEDEKRKYNSSELNKLKEELANFSEALARRIKNDINQKDNEYSLKKEFSDEEKKDLQEYKQKIRNKALKLAEDAVSYAKKLMKD